MIYNQLGERTYVMRLEMGDDILGKIRHLAEAEKVRAGSFEGIGSLNKAKLGHYDFREKRYSYEVFEDDLEIITLAGNISTMDGTIIPHAHATLGRRDFTVVGGHLDDGSSANMVEIVLTKLPGRLLKSKDERVGLNLLYLTRKL